MNGFEVEVTFHSECGPVWPAHSNPSWHLTRHDGAVGHLPPDDSDSSTRSKQGVSTPKAASGKPRLLRRETSRDACGSGLYTNGNGPKIWCFILNREVLGTRTNPTRACYPR